MSRLISILPFMLFAGGCARYEYNITQPQEFARHIGASDDVTLKRDGLDYKFRTVDNRLVVRIYNTGEAAVSLIGQKSTVVDAGGQSHPLRDLTIAPGSFGKLIFPPMKPRLEREGPSIGIGVGGVFGDAGHRRSRSGHLYESSFEPAPQYLSVVDDDVLYWDWDGDTTIRLTLAFDRSGSTFTVDFTLKRQKM